MVPSDLSRHVSIDAAYLMLQAQIGGLSRLSTGKLRGPQDFSGGPRILVPAGPDVFNRSLC